MSGGKPEADLTLSAQLVTQLPQTQHPDLADLAPPRAAEASTWAAFLKALHQPAPGNAPANDFRGVPLRDREPAMQTRIDRLRGVSDQYTSHIEQLWESGLAAPEATTNSWLHGDLHAQNVLTDNQVFAAVIDWGDITSGDAATDLASIWALFPDHSARQRVLELYQPDQPTLDRTLAWAIMFSVILLDSGLINSRRHAAMGRDMLRRVSADT